MNHVERYAWKATLKDGKKEEYVRRHNEIWSEMVSVLKEAGIENYSIWLQRLELLGLGGLRAQTQSVDAAGLPHRQDLAPRGGRVALHRDLGVGEHVKGRADGLEQLGHAVGREQGGRTTAEIDGVYGRLFGISVCRPGRAVEKRLVGLRRLAYPSGKLMGISLHPLGGRARVGAKIAVGTFTPAEWDMQVQTDGFTHTRSASLS